MTFTKALIPFCIAMLSGLIGFAQASGIYVLDNDKGLYRDANIRSYSFVDGFVWRSSWAEIETAKDVYDFTGLDHIVRRLDSIDKKLSILFGAYSVEPTYIAAETGVTTYPFTNPLSSLTSDRAVPYDAFLLQRFRIFLAALAKHPIYSISLGKDVALSQHPVLANIATNIPGLGAIRNVNGSSTNLQSVLPGYSRKKFVDSLLASMLLQTGYFGDKNVFIPFYKNINDSVNSPSLASYIRTQLLQMFDGTSNPKISFWQENLAGFTDTVSKVFTGLPTTSFASPLYLLKDSAYTMFQMLQGWTTPFLDPAKTANSTPFDAMCYAYNTYGTSYFEVYVSDIDDTVYQKGFKTWAPLTSCSPSSAIQEQNAQVHIRIYPNPATDWVQFEVLPSSLPIRVAIKNVLGQPLLYADHAHMIDISRLSKGYYIAEILVGQERYHSLFLKQ